MQNIPDISIVPLVSPPVQELCPAREGKGGSASGRQRQQGQRAGGGTAADVRIVRVNEFFSNHAFSANTRRNYDRELRRFLAWTDKPWHEMTPRLLGQYRVYLVQELKRPTSVNLALSALKSFFNWFCETYPDHLAQAPTQFEFEKVPAATPKNLQPEQVAALHQVLQSQNTMVGLRDLALVAVLSHGLRAAEAVALNVGSYDGRMLLVSRSKDYSQGRVPLKKEACDAIQAYLDERTVEGEELLPESPLLVSYHPKSAGGARLTYSGLYRLVKQWGEAAGLPDLHPHQFRHTYATELLLLGMDSFKAMALTGHRSDKVFDRYVKASREAAAAQEFYRLIGE